jgi:hypothetical protein
MRNMVKTISIAILSAPFLMINPVYAAQTFYAAPPGYVVQNSAPVLSDQEIDARINALTQRLHAQERSAAYWEYGWGAFNGGTMIWSAVQAGQDQGRKNRNTDIVQATESLIGLADVVFRPLPAFHADSVCKEPIDTEHDRLQCLADKEALLDHSAQRANAPYEVLPHLGNLAFNLVAGLIVWRVADTSHALATAIPGTVIGEIQLWTTPQQPVRDFDQYKMHFSPLVRQGDRSRSPTTGLIFTFSF